MERINNSSKTNDWPRLAVVASVLVYFIAASILVYLALGKPQVGVDDANIVMVYAKNIVAGKGIVYSAGEERVEGYSSPLSLALFSFFFLWSKTPETALLLLNFIFAATAAFLVLNSIRKTAETFRIGNIFFYFLAFSYLAVMLANPAYFARNIISLMDNGLYSLLIVLGFVFLVNLQGEKKVLFKHSLQISALILLTIPSRPEGVVWAAIFLAVYFIKNSSSKNSLLPAFSFFGALAALEIFRLMYFGYPLPNTFYAKVSASLPNNLRDGLGYLAAFGSKYWIVGMLALLSSIIIAGIFVLSRHKTLESFEKEINAIAPPAVIVIIFILAGLALPVVEGGDIFNDFRMYQNIYPLLFVPVIYLVLIFNRYFLPVAAAGVFLFLNWLLFFVNPAGWEVFHQNNRIDRMPGDQSFRIVSEYFIASGSRENGLRLNVLFKDYLPTIGYGSAGGIAFTYAGIVYDLMGLNNTKMAHADPVKIGPKAHASFNKEVFYELSPDILMPTAFPATETADLDQVKGYYTSTSGWDNIIFKNIFNDELFKRRYTLAVVGSRREPVYKCFGFFNNRFLAEISNDPGFVKEKVLKY